MSPRSISSSSPPPTKKTALKSSSGKKIADDEFMASAIGDVEWLKQSLRGSRNAINYDPNGLAPIHLAAIHGRLECLKFLVEKLKIDVDLASSTGWRPIHLCISNQTGRRSFACLSYLLSQGANPSVANEDGVTPMHQAASEGHVLCLKALIEAGGVLDGVDRRGHKPLDLAKLWGHRKCARILATEQWHQDKEVMSVEMAYLKHMKMNQVLKEMDAEDEMKADQEFYGDIAFKQWMDNKGLNQRTESASTKDAMSTASSVSEKKSIISKTPSESLFKANSRQPIKESSTKRAPSTISEETVKPRRDPLYAGFEHEERPITADDLRLYESNSQKDQTPKTAEPLHRGFYNPNDWINSTKLHPSRRPYLPLLPDHYPRDEFTKKPKFPPKRLDRTVIHRAIEQHSGGFLMKEPVSPVMPKLPPDVIDSVLNGDAGERPVVYKCKHIADVHQRKHLGSHHPPETGLHLTDDVQSPMFRQGLLARKTGSSSSKRSSSQNSASALNLPEMMSMLQRLNKPSQFLATSG